MVVRNNHRRVDDRHDARVIRRIIIVGGSSSGSMKDRSQKVGYHMLELFEWHLSCETSKQ